ncbi:MAG TPA: hypothetical protein VFM04_05260 [Candidatus Methylomirabilis sp.]|nr:hypothetical protein [Candidatus Methylomirabilis sp.]
MRRSLIGTMMTASVIGLSLMATGAKVIQHTGSPDTRQRVRLPPAGRDKVLAEMRTMLGSVSAILQALTANDLLSVERAARASGMAMAADVDPQVEKHLPKPFLDLGMKTHQGFDELADRVKAGGTRDEVIQQLARLTANCVACHTIYRIDEAP